MGERQFFDLLLVSWFGLAVLVFAALFFVVAPYGRHVRGGWGPALPDRPAWVLMESVSAIGFALCFVWGRYAGTATALLFLGLWQAHYLQRAFIYPWKMRGNARGMPVSVFLLAVAFNAANSYLNGRYLFELSGGYADHWLLDPRCIVGTGLFAVGYAVNRRADRILRELRKPGERRYSIPEGGLYRWISCPNYLGEIVIWAGWAVATWSLPGLAFFLFTVANLAPRARAHHRWYRAHFQHYPAERKALVPGLW